MIKNKEVGILALTEFFGLEDWNFVKTAYSDQESLALPNISIKWHKPNQHSQENLTFFSCVYTRLHTKKYNLILLGVPHSLRKDFLLSDLQFPFTVAGCVLIVNLHTAWRMKSFMEKQYDTISQEETVELEESEPSPNRNFVEQQGPIKFKERFNHWQVGGIAWIRKHKLPFVVVFIKPEVPAITENEMRDLLELESHIPVISCSLELSENRVLIDFDREDIERVLSALVEQIEAEGKP